MNDDVRRSGIPNPSEHLRRMEENSRKIAKAIGSTLPQGWGFALLIFDFNSPELTWISSAQRKDMVKRLREVADRLELDSAGGPVAPGSQ